MVLVFFILTRHDGTGTCGCKKCALNASCFSKLNNSFEDASVYSNVCKIVNYLLSTYQKKNNSKIKLHISVDNTVFTRK